MNNKQIFPVPITTEELIILLNGRVPKKILQLWKKGVSPPFRYFKFGWKVEGRIRKVRNFEQERGHIVKK